MDWGGDLVNVLAVSSIKLGRYPRLRAAVVRVDRAGENNQAWANATRSADVAEWTAGAKL